MILVGSLMRPSLALASIGVETFPRERLHFGGRVAAALREGAARCQLPALVCTATMTLYLHRAERADRLVIALGDLLSNPLPDAFATEIISVPTRGVERWLSQGLAQRLGAAPGRSDGVCVGVAFPSPRRLVARALAGSAADDDIDPWRPHHAVWPLLRVIDRCRGEAWAAMLWHHLRGNGGSTHPDRDPRRTPLVDRAASRRPLRQVRGDSTGHDRELGPRAEMSMPWGSRCRRIERGKPNCGVGCAKR